MEVLNPQMFGCLLEVNENIQTMVFQATIFHWLFQLDDEPNLYMGNGLK